MEKDYQRKVICIILVKKNTLVKNQMSLMNKEENCLEKHQLLIIFMNVIFLFFFFLLIKKL